MMLRGRFSIPFLLAFTFTPDKKSKKSFFEGGERSAEGSGWVCG
jgi:hypothetical protein